MGMPNWRQVLGWDRHSRHDRHESGHQWQEHRRLLPCYADESVVSAIPADQVTKIALRLHHLVEKCIPMELDEAEITKPNSRIITDEMIKTAREAGGQENKACVVFCLLINSSWWQHQAFVELWDADLHRTRAMACEQIAKRIIESEEDASYLMHHVLLQRYSTQVDGKPTPATNVVEKAVDLHALRVIGSSGYQKCVSFLWRGWLVQDEDDPSKFVDYKHRDNESFSMHLDPDRMRAPMYQNAAQMLISFVYLALYTGAINTPNPAGDMDVVEVLLYVFTLGFICDEFTKFWKAGRHIWGFRNAFNFVLYSGLVVSFVLRCIALGHPLDDGAGRRNQFNTLGYNFLAATAPMFWIRLLLYLDGFRFFGAMLVVVKTMMRESIIFFALLAVVVAGFLQSFIGLDYADDQEAGDVAFIVQSMAFAIMQSPDFSGFERFQHPFGLVLYCCFTLIVMLILLNILIALYNSAYQDIYDNANDEFLALFAQKTLQFVRAPDENVFIPPFNLIEVFLLALPLEWWMDKKLYGRINDMVMGVIYFPLLLAAAFFEVRTASEIRANRARGEEDEDRVEEWEQMRDQVDFDADGWNDTVAAVKPNLDEDPAASEVKMLREEVEHLKQVLEGLSKLLAEAPGSST